MERIDLTAHDEHDLDLDLGVEELDEMLAPWDWDDFFGGVAIGVGLVGVYAGGAALAT